MNCIVCTSHRVSNLYTYSITLVSAFCIQHSNSHNWQCCHVPSSIKKVFLVYIFFPFLLQSLTSVSWFQCHSCTGEVNDYVSCSVSFLVLPGLSLPCQEKDWMSEVFLQDTQTHGSTLKSKAIAVRPAAFSSVHLDSPWPRTGWLRISIQVIITNTLRHVLKQCGMPLVWQSWRGLLRDRHEVKILCGVEGTGAYQCCKNNRKLVIIVWPTDLAHLPMWSVSQLMEEVKAFKTLGARLLQFAHLDYVWGGPAV